MITLEERIALCALNSIYGFHPKEALKLIEERGGAPALVSAEDIEKAKMELGKALEAGARFICIGDEDYPEPLLECEDPPLGLYVKSSDSPAAVFSLRPMIAFVGTRDLSPYGREWCERLVRGLSAADVKPCIVSGLALGADSVAHRTALDCGLPTIGVMATGIDGVYPWQHRDLAKGIVEAPGSALVTDYPPGTSPVALNFLRRNRIIAGLSRAVVVVESKNKGGSLMTARFATEYNRDVFALPGRVDDIRSAGCNSLIAENMAEIVLSAEQLAFRTGLSRKTWRGGGGSWVHGKVKEGEDPLRNVLEKRYGKDSLELITGLAIRANRGATAEQIAADLGLGYVKVLEAIGLLEADGIVQTDLLRRCSINPSPLLTGQP